MSTQFEPGLIPTAAETIPLCVPEIRGNEWKYIKECLDTKWVSSVGSYVTQFEQVLADYVNVAHGVATVNGTAALHTALLAAGVQADDEVILSTLSFIAPANAVRYIGAYPVLIDAEDTYWQMDVEVLRAFLEDHCEYDGRTIINKKTRRRVQAIIPVHILGHPVDIEAVCALAATYGLTVIEDATEGLGASFRGRKLGSLGQMACFSFNGNKLITTGGGGMLVTNNADLAQRARYLTTQAKDDPVEYIHHEVGYNYRLTNLQAAMGCAQMEQITDYIAKKRTIAEVYAQAFADVPGIQPMPASADAESVYWLYTIRVDSNIYGMTRRALHEQLAAQKIMTRPLWQPLHQSPALAKQRVTVNGKVAEELNQSCLSIPCSVGLTSAQQARVIDAIRALAR